jgi:hypothetical protein
MRLILAALALLAAVPAAWADGLVLPPAVERDAPFRAIYRLDRRVTGPVSLAVAWTDSLGRLVERRTIAADLHGATDIAFRLDARRAVAMQNAVHATLSRDGRPIGTADGTFIARPAAGWNDYRILMWHNQDAVRTAALPGLGVQGGKILGIRDPVVDPAEFRRRFALQLGLDQRWFVENIATDLYSAYHMWTPEQPAQVNWRYLALQKAARANPSDPALWARVPSLSDPVWIARIGARLADTVRDLAPYRPYYYNLGDETGIADLAAAWDFDFSPVSLAAFRVWLQRQYSSLAALNAEWGSDFASWAAIVPPTTTQAMARADGNYASWSDFKDFMDSAMAGAMRAGTAAVHAADPTALAAIEGAQVPGWGGYDYTRLSHAVDVMEMYDAGNNVQIVRALNPALTILSTAFESGPHEQHRVWHELLQGERGLIIWDDEGKFTTPQGGPGPRAADAPTYRRLRDGIGAQIIAAVPVAGPVGILYSPASFRMRWMLDHREAGDAWTQRGSEQEGQDDALRVAMRTAAATLTHAGLQPQFLSPARIAGGALRHGMRALVLPDCLALSPAEISEIRAFHARGGIVLADGTPARFDGHGRRLPHPALEGIAIPLADMPAALARAGIAADFSLAGADGRPVRDVSTRVLRDGDVTILALQRDEATPARPGPVTLTLRRPGFVHDMLTPGDAWQRMDRLVLTLDPVVPTLLAIAAAAPPPFSVRAPPMLAAGATGALRIRRAAWAGGAAEVLHIDAIDPAGQAVPMYSGNLRLASEHGTWRLPMALNDKPGRWVLRVHDVLTGRTADVAMTLLPPGR